MELIKIDRRKLIAILAERKLNYKGLSELLSSAMPYVISISTVSFNNRHGWTQQEIKTVCTVLGVMPGSLIGG